MDRRHPGMNYASGPRNARTKRIHKDLSILLLLMCVGRIEGNEDLDKVGD